MMKDSTSIFGFPTSVASFSIKAELDLLNVSTYWAIILKWKEGVRNFRSLCHFAPKINSFLISFIMQES